MSRWTAARLTEPDRQIGGVAVILAALAVWALRAGWPDILVATGLLVLFLRSASRVLASAWREIRQPA